MRVWRAIINPSRYALKMNIYCVYIHIYNLVGLWNNWFFCYSNRLSVFTMVSKRSCPGQNRTWSLLPATMSCGTKQWILPSCTRLSVLLTTILRNILYVHYYCSYGPNIIFVCLSAFVRFLMSYASYWNTWLQSIYCLISLLISKFISVVIEDRRLNGIFVNGRVFFFHERNFFCRAPCGLFLKINTLKKSVLHPKPQTPINVVVD